MHGSCGVIAGGSCRVQCGHDCWHLNESHATFTSSHVLLGQHAGSEEEKGSVGVPWDGCAHSTETQGALV